MERILVVDDDIVIRKFLRSILENKGYEVLEASNGKTAIKLYYESPADVIILDLVMPEKEGIETLMELKRDFPDVKVITISGGVKGEADILLTAAKDLGAIYTFKKPLDSAQMLEVVGELLQKN